MPITCRTNTKSDGVTSAPASGACPTCSTPFAAIGIDRQLDKPPSLRTVHLIGILNTSALAASAICMSNFERAAEATRSFAGWTGLPAKVRFRARTYRQLLAHRGHRGSNGVTEHNRSGHAAGRKRPDRSLNRTLRLICACKIYFHWMIAPANVWRWWQTPCLASCVWRGNSIKCCRI